MSITAGRTPENADGYHEDVRYCTPQAKSRETGNPGMLNCRGYELRNGEQHERNIYIQAIVALAQKHSDIL